MTPEAMVVQTDLPEHVQGVDQMLDTPTSPIGRWRVDEEALSRPWPPFIQKGVQHQSQPVYVRTGHLEGGGKLEMLPLPNDDAELFGVQDVDPPGIPPFDPAVHLSLELPAYVEKLGEFAPVPAASITPVDSNQGSELAFTAPFPLLSAEGVRVLRELLKHHPAKKTHRSYQHRGLYHFSPFVRSLCNDPSVLGMFGALTGEPVVPHQLLMDACFANESRKNEEAVVKGTADPWHFDSCTYVAVTLLSDPMEGGDLQVVRRSRDEALHRIAETRNQLEEPEIVTVDYETPGKCILVQGSEIVHRVTRVTHSPKDEPRIALGIGLQPASPFRWDKTNLDTFARYDGLTASAYEFYRMKAWALGSGLTELARTTPSSVSTSTSGRRELAGRLRAMAAELERVAGLVETEALPAADFVGFVDEAKMSESKL